MMTDIYLKPRTDGQDILLLNGLPILTGGLDNMIYMLLVTGDYWGNTEAGENGLLDSTIPQIMAQRTLTNQSRLNIIEEAKRVTKILVSSGIAERIEITGEIPRVGVMSLAVKTFEPEIEEGTDFNYLLNWELQKVGLLNSEPDPEQGVIFSTYVSDTGEIFISDSGEIYISDSYLV